MSLRRPLGARPVELGWLCVEDRSRVMGQIWLNTKKKTPPNSRRRAGVYPKEDQRNKRVCTLHLCLSFRACQGMVNPDDPSDHRAHTTTSTHNHDRPARTTPGPSSSAPASPAVAPVADCSCGIRDLGLTWNFRHRRGPLILLARSAVTGLVAKLPTESGHPSLFKRSTAH